MVANVAVASCLEQGSESDENDEGNGDAISGGATLDQKVVYLNNASQANLSDKVQRVGITAIRAVPASPHADGDKRRIRQLYAALIDAHESEIAIHPSTAFAITLAAKNIQNQLRLKWEELGDDRNRSSESTLHILVLQDQMNSAVYPWQDICHRSGGKLKLMVVQYPSAEEQGWTDAVLEHLDSSVVVACLPPLHWSDGALLDLPKIGKVCKDRGITLIVDSTQATGILHCSVREIQAAVMACSVHKWLRAPSGVSLVYIAPELHSTWVPLDQHCRGRDLAGGSEWDASQDLIGPDGYPEKFFQDARKFDGGGKPNPVLLPMLRAALEEVVYLDLSRVQAYLKALMTPLLDWARSHDFDLTPGSHAYHLVGIRPKHLTPHQMVEIASRLEAEEQIYIAVRCGAFRISPYIDTEREDIDRLIHALSNMLV